MLKVFANKACDEVLLETNCTDGASFLVELAQALGELKNSDAVLGVLENAMPIAFRLAGYKAEAVRETRQLVCGAISPGQSTLLLTVDD